MDPNRPIWRSQGIWAHDEALREEGRRIEPLYDLNEPYDPAGSEGTPNDGLVEFAELEPCVTGVLVFDFKDDNPAFSRAARNAVWLAPSDCLAGGELEPGRSKVMPM